MSLCNASNLAICAAVSLLSMGVTWSVHAQGYDVEVLPGGASSSAEGVNDAGQVTGSRANNSAAALWSGGTVTDLGNLPGETYSQATAINNAGQVVGVSGQRVGPVATFADVVERGHDHQPRCSPRIPLQQCCRHRRRRTGGGLATTQVTVLSARRCGAGARSRSWPCPWCGHSALLRPSTTSDR